MRGSPYNIEQSKNKQKEANNNYNNWVELRDFINDTFLDMISE